MIRRELRLIDAKELLEHAYRDRLDSRERIANMIKRAPTVYPKTGRWIEASNCYYRCSECGEHYQSMYRFMEYHYCPNCGAKMLEPQESEG